MKNRALMTVAGLVFLLGLAVPSWAELIAYDGFDYTVGSELPTGHYPAFGMYAWVEYTTPKSVIASGSLPNTLVQSTGNSLDVLAADNQLMYLKIASPLSLDQDVTYYMSCVIQAKKDDAGLFYLQFDHWGNVRVRIQDGQPTLSYDNVRADTGAQRATQTDAYLMVLKVEGHATGDDHFYLGMFGPNDTLTEPTTWEMETTGDKGASTGSCSMYLLGNEARANYRLDEVRVGTTWADVTPAPEPASLALLACGAVLGVRRRRSAQ